MRPKGIAVLAGEEGLGKSIVGVELAIRLACGTGSLFGKYPITTKRAVLLFDEENGAMVQHEREDDMLSALGLTRKDVGGNYARYSFAGTRLDEDDGRHAFEERIKDFDPALVIIDTGGMVMDDEHGATFKRVIQYVRQVCEAFGLTVLFIVHLVKPERDEKSRARAHKSGRGITEVMGHWARVADCVMVMSQSDTVGKAIWTVSKRWGNSQYVIEHDNGVWKAVAALREAKAIVVDRLDTTLLNALKSKQMKADDLLDYLNKMPDPPSRPTVYRRLKALADKGMAQSVEGLWGLTPDGAVWLADRTKDQVRLVLS